MLKNFLRNRRTLVLLAVTAAILACSSVAALAAVAGSASDKISDHGFNAKSVTIRKGGRVTWTWVGQLTHNVAVVSGPAKFRSRKQVRGTYSHIFTKAGTYHLECTIHPFMKMTVVVK
jgi:plastocyanin